MSCALLGAYWTLTSCKKQSWEQRVTDERKKRVEFIGPYSRPLYTPWKTFLKTDLFWSLAATFFIKMFYNQKIDFKF